MRHTSPTAPRRCVLRCRTSPRRRWPGAVALVMWNMRKYIFLIAAKQPQRGWRSRAGVLCPFIGAKRRPLTATAAEATARERAGTSVSASVLCSQQVPAIATAGYSRSNREPPISPSTALLPTGSRSGNLQQLRSNPRGVTCPYSTRCFSSVVLRRAGHGCQRWPQTALNISFR